ncbi:MAG TPA: helix-turn-helix domain-containing protein, partial [Bacillota bacterium]|nr:helix-turn-helix domain-containing protein [Bacillota bacterium]
IGSPFIAVSAIQESYQQAREAIELGIRYHPEANSVIFDYGQVSLYDLIGCMATCKDRSAYGRELVEQISLYDRVNGTEFLKTLEVVLDFGGKRKDAASCLNIHPNTLDYRMRRLNEVVQCSLDDPGLRLAVHLWIKAIGCPRGVLEDTDGETS